MSKPAKGWQIPYGRYFGIMCKQAITNFEYTYFFLMGFFVEVALVRPHAGWHFLVLLLINILAGLAGVTNVVARVDKAFDTLGLNFEKGFGKPRWNVNGKRPFNTDVLYVHAAGYGTEDFKPFLSQIASRLNQPVKEIRKSPNSPTLEVLLRKAEIPTLLKFSELPIDELKQGEFFVGQSDDGLEKLLLSRMIHMLVAGQTGGGKTQFIKQIMATVLTRTRESKIYLIDMKGGVDFQGFLDAPNFEIATTYTKAMALISEMERLFEFRRDYLLKKKKENWSELSMKDLSKDKSMNDRPLGPVLIVVDELAELVKDASDSDSDGNLQDSISKLARLSRVTGIHLCLGTQYPSKNIIRGDSKTNLPTRVCFSVPDVSASTLVVGDMTATTIGKNPGRAVYAGPSTKVIQAPLLDNFKLGEMILEYGEKQKINNKNVSSNSPDTINEGGSAKKNRSMS